MSSRSTSANSQKNDVNVVTFEDIRPHYTAGEDIFVVYRLASGFTPSKRDWVGLYRCGWSGIYDYVAFQWAPKCSREGNFPTIRSILFKGSSLAVRAQEDASYQFVYISKLSQVKGASSAFRIHDYDPGCDLSFTLVDSPVEGVGSLTLIKSPSSPDKDLLDTFELVRSGSQSSSTSDGPKTATPSLISLGILKELLDNMDAGKENPETGEEDQSPPAEAVIDLLADHILEQQNQEPMDGKKQNLHQLATPIPGCLTRTEDHVSLVSDFQNNNVCGVTCNALQGVEVGNEHSVVPYQTRAVVPFGSFGKIHCILKSGICQAAPLEQFHCDLTPTDDGVRLQTAEAKLLDEVETSMNAEKSNEPSEIKHQSPANSLNQTHQRLTDTNMSPSSKKLNCSKRPMLSCRECKRRRANLKNLRDRLGQSSRALKKTQDELVSSEETLSLKTLLVDELSRQVKNLIHENGNLTTANETLHGDRQRLRNLLQENRKLLAKSTKSLSRIEELQLEAKRLKSENSWLDHCVQASVDENAHLHSKLSNMAAELKEVDHAQTQCNPTDINNNLLADWHPPLALPHDDAEEDGWKVARSRKAERHLAIIREHENTICQLCRDLKHHLKTIASHETMIEELKASEQNHLAEIATQKETLENMHLAEQQHLLTITSSQATIQNFKCDVKSHLRTIDLQKATINDLDDAEERHLLAIASLEDRLEELDKVKDQLINRIQQRESLCRKLDTQIQEEKSLSRMLRHEVHDVTHQLHASRDKETSVCRLLAAEKNKNMDIRADIEHQVATLQQRILSLQDALETTQLSHQNHLLKKHSQTGSAHTCQAVPKRKPAGSGNSPRKVPGFATVIQGGHVMNSASSAPVSQDVITCQPSSQKADSLPPRSQESLRTQDSSVLAHGAVVQGRECTSPKEVEGAVCTEVERAACKEAEGATGSSSSVEDANPEESHLAEVVYEKEDSRQEKKQKIASRGKAIKAAKPRKPRKFVFQSVNSRSGGWSPEAAEYTPRLHAANPRDTFTM